MHESHVDRTLGPDRPNLDGRSLPSSVRVLTYARFPGGVRHHPVAPDADSATVTPEREWSLPFFALVIAFGLSEATALHVEIRKESHSLSLAGIPLLAGLLYTSPALVAVAYVLGGCAALLWIRRSSLLKVIWNACLFVAEVGVAGLIVHTALGDGLPENPVEWVIPLGAVVAAELLSLFAVPLVIMAVDAKFRPGLFANVGQSQVLAVLAGTFAVTAMSASLSSPYMAAYALAAADRCRSDPAEHRTPLATVPRSSAVAHLHTRPGQRAWPTNTRHRPDRVGAHHARPLSRPGGGRQRRGPHHGAGAHRRHLRGLRPGTAAAHADRSRRSGCGHRDRSR